ncbi:NADP-dependent oxidoreductase [Phytohabitans sp. ZYX-F-186]|uniref:NADP-dependent oxidoreductase n=1 Tax=Phytohabitans maris TaxID=3071409 RepID=A0ABU0ZQP8_9ACTN|nr:NADP-dependent oxidoreductase [Phytohabitans sp. ZYX-F-186]MDQ7909359.1 NADP-dependent oxidoreductase [Phytohabitans sp. ZYX-F-186]
MRAVRFDAFGGPEVLRVVELPEPHPGPGEVRIRVRAATVNPTDLLTRSGIRGKVTRGVRLPYTLGMEAAGEVDEVGDGVELAVGDRVMALTLPFGPHGGAYAEHVVVPRPQVVAVPAGMPAVEAATIPMNGLTAVLAVEALPATAGAWVGVTGAAGCVGGYAVQLAVAAGLRVVADAAPADEALVRSLGAHAVVERGDGVSTRFRAVAPGGLAGLVDASTQQGRLVPALADRGTLILLRAWDSAPGRDIRSRFVTVVEALDRPELLVRLRDLAERGVLTPRVATTLPAERAPEAHRLVAGGGVRGRVVLTF